MPGAGFPGASSSTSTGGAADEGPKIEEID